MRYISAIDSVEFQHFSIHNLIQSAVASALLVFFFNFLTCSPAQAASRICNASKVQILIAYMWPDGTFGAGDLDYIKVEGWHVLRPGQCEKNEGSHRVAIAQLDGNGKWGFPDYTFDGPTSVWRVYNNSRHSSCVAAPGKRFRYGPGPTRRPCPAGFIETTFFLEAQENGNNLFPATATIKTTVFPKLYNLENEPVTNATQPTAPPPSASPPAKAPDPYLTKLNGFVVEIIISRAIPLLCPDNYTLAGATTPDEHAKALGIDNYRGLVEASENAVLLLLDPKKVDDPITKSRTTPEITQTARSLIEGGKKMREQEGCSSPLFRVFLESSHLYQAKVGKH